MNNGKNIINESDEKDPLLVTPSALENQLQNLSEQNKKEFYKLIANALENDELHQSKCKLIIVGGIQCLVLGFVTVGTVPLYLRTSMKVTEKDSLFMQIVVPFSVVVNNISQNVLSTVLSYVGVKEILKDINKSKVRKVIEMGLACIVFGYGSLATLSAVADVVKKEESHFWKTAIIIGTGVTLPLNYMGAVGLTILASEKVFALLNILRPGLSEELQSQQKLKDEFLTMLEMAGKQIKNNPKGANKIKDDINTFLLNENNSAAVTLLLEQSNLWRKQQKPEQPNTCAQSFFKAVGKFSSVIWGLNCAFCVSTFACTGQTFWEQFMEKTYSWITAGSSLFSLYYGMYQIGKVPPQFLFDNILRYWRGEPMDVPVYLRNYPKTVAIGSLLLVTLVIFSYGTSKDYILNYCPELFKKSLYALLESVDSVNGTMLLTIYYTALNAFIKNSGSNDEKASIKMHEDLQVLFKNIKGQSLAVFKSHIGDNRVILNLLSTYSDIFQPENIQKIKDAYDKNHPTPKKTNSDTPTQINEDKSPGKDTSDENDSLGDTTDSKLVM